MTSSQCFSKLNLRFIGNWEGVVWVEFVITGTLYMHNMYMYMCMYMYYMCMYICMYMYMYSNKRKVSRYMYM